MLLSMLHVYNGFMHVSLTIIIKQTNELTEGM